MSNKHCPICGKEEWDYDVVEYGTGWTFCGDCYDTAKSSGLFTKIDDAVKESRHQHDYKKVQGLHTNTIDTIVKG